ncbi:MAG: DUF1573 domain-containing protein [Acidobacteriota bacterium]
MPSLPTSPLPRVLCLTLLGAFLLAAAPLAAAPQAVLVEPIKDFSVIPKGESVTHVFSIRNAGDEPLLITDVRPACGCTVAKYDKEIAPGANGSIEATVDTAEFSGPISKAIVVFTNDPENAKLQLAIKADVKPYLEVSPGYARFTYVQGEPEGTLTQSIFAYDGSPIEVVDIKSKNRHLRLNKRLATESERNEKARGNQWMVEITLDQEAPVGALREMVEVVTDHPKQRIVKVPVSGFIRPRQHATPQVVQFGDIPNEALPLQRGVEFTNFAASPIQISKVEIDHDSIVADVDRVVEDGHRFRFVLTIPDATPKGPFETVIRIHTTDAKQPIFEVPVRGSVL